MMKNIFRKLREDTSIVSVELRNPRVNAIFSEQLGKYVVSMSGIINTGKIKKILGFNKPMFFNIIVDIEEEVYYHVITEKISKVWFCGDCCDLIDSGDSVSMFWRNQRESDRQLRIATAAGTELRYNKSGCYISGLDLINEKTGGKHGRG
jgi:hypothetical protein